MKSILFKSILLAAVILLASAKPVFAAYIDPNTGGMVFQLLAVLFGVISGIILLFSSRIKASYYRLRRSMRGRIEGEEEASEE